MADPSDQLGIVSSRHEGNGPATISTGQDDHGGASYGTYQLSSKQGTLSEYLAQSTYKDKFAGLTPATVDFDNKWRELASSDPEFARDQQVFIVATHYDVQKTRLKNAGVDLSARGAAVQEAIFSTSVQFGNRTEHIFIRGMTEKFGAKYKLANLSDKDIVAAVQDYKIEHNEQLFKNSRNAWSGLLRRAQAEKADLLALADGLPLPDLHAADVQRVAMKSGSHGHGVVELQQQLGQLGFALKADGRYGPATAAAVRSFQQAHDLRVDGVASGATLKAVAAETRALVEISRCGPTWPPIRLDDPAHPDHGLFLDARALVHELDRQHDRLPDQRSDNLASSLVVAARREGPQRLDDIALSDDASMVWGAQRANRLGMLSVDGHCRVNTLQGLNTPLEQSGSQWLRAMHQFNQIQQEALTQVLPQAALEPAMPTSQAR